MYLDHNENLKGQEVLIDPWVHKKTKLSREQFLDKVDYVKSIRTAFNSSYISFYITSVDENNNLLKFHNLINKGIFDFRDYHVFAVAIQPKLYNWFKTTTITVIQKQITCWLAGAYFFRPDKREIQKQQIYLPLFEEILKIVENHYSDFELPDFKLLEQKLWSENDETIFDEHDKCIEKYLTVCKEVYNSEPPEFLRSPFDYENIKEWGVNEYHNFEFVEAYFSERDWENIVVGNSKDDLHRVESRDDLWLKWKHIYSAFDQRKNFVYSFYFDPDEPLKKSIRHKRETISQDVKNQVWQRDNGVCVQCGSNEKLEFDHIIPVVKGGSSTYRNIQLLCEPCNRKKRDKI